MLQRDTIIEALQRLGRKAAARQLKAEIAIYGGTVMMLAYNARPGTKDVDAIFRPREEIKALAEEVAHEMGIDSGWLNDDVRLFAANAGGAGHIDFVELADVPGLVITRPAAKYLLAMKARAARLLQGSDFDDLVLLLRHARVRTIDEVEGINERYFPGEPLDERQRAFVETALARAHEPPPSPESPRSR